MRLESTMLDDAEILRYLGYRGQPLNDALQAQIARCKQAVCDAAKPKTMSRGYAFTADGLLEGTTLTLPGQDIRRHLAGCHTAVLFASTLGSDVETLLMRTQVLNMADALVMDACASTAIEYVCDTAEATLRRGYEQNGHFLTGRFSPGYGDLPLSLQPEFVRVLNTARQIGLTVSESGLLLPRKSVTAVLGVSSTPHKPHKPDCAACRMHDTCPFRKEGTNCGK